MGRVMIERPAPGASRDADIRTYPVKSGESVVAGDVVDIISNQISKTLAGVERGSTSLETKNSGLLSMCTLDSSRVAVFYRLGDVCCRICTVSGDNISVGPENRIASVGTLYSLKAVALSPSLVALCMAAGSSDWHTEDVYACSVSGTSATVGASNQALRYSAPYGYDMVRLTSTSFMVLGSVNYNDRFDAVVYSVSGTTLSQKATTNLAPGIDKYAKVLSLTQLSDYSGSARVCVCYDESASLRAAVMLVPSSGVPAVGAMVDINLGLTIASAFYMKSRWEEGYLLLAGKTTEVAEIRGKVLSINGTTVGAGGASVALGETGYNDFHLEFNNGVYALFHIINGSTTKSNVVKLARSGTTILKQGTFVCSKVTITQGYSSVAPISTDKFLFAYNDLISLFAARGNDIANEFINGSTQAIALTSGAAGQSIDVIFDGTAELPGITAGTSITSPGVQGYSPQDGWLWVKPEWDGKPFVVGAYTGAGKNESVIDVGFEPSAVFVRIRSSDGASHTGLALRNFPVTPTSTGDIYLEIQSTGFVVRGTLNDGNSNFNPYRYIAFR